MVGALSAANNDPANHNLIQQIEYQIKKYTEKFLATRYNMTKWVVGTMNGYDESDYCSNGVKLLIDNLTPLEHESLSL